MHYIRKLQESDVDAFVVNAINAFPGGGISEEDVDERKNFLTLLINYAFLRLQYFGIYNLAQRVKVVNNVI